MNYIGIAIHSASCMAIAIHSHRVGYSTQQFADVRSMGNALGKLLAARKYKRNTQICVSIRYEKYLGSVYMPKTEALKKLGINPSDLHYSTSLRLIWEHTLQSAMGADCKAGEDVCIDAINVYKYAENLNELPGSVK